MSLGWRPRNILLGMTLCLLLPVSVRTAPAAEDRADVATVVSRLNSGKEQIRRSAIPLIEWEQGHDEEYVAALGGLIEAAVRRPALDSAFGAVLKLADCPLPAASDTIAKALSAADWRLAMMAVDILGQRRADDHAAAIREIWDRPDARRSYALRHAVVCSLGEIGGPRSVGESVNLLPNLDGQLQYEAVARLSRRTGAKHGSDAVAWKEWWTAQDGKVPEVPVAKDDPLPQDLPWQRTVPRFFHVPIYSNRVVFVLDRSQSMLSTLRGKTRLEAMQEEFAKVVRQLPEASSFGLIVFNDRVEIWKNKLVASKSSNMSAAVQAIYALEATGKTAVFDALEAGLQLDDELEQIVFLTDGRPTAGKITNDVEIVEAIARLNRYRRVRIDCLGIDTDGAPEQLLQEIARRNFGAYSRIR